MLKKFTAVIFSFLLLVFLGANTARAQGAQQAADTLTSTFSNYPIKELWEQYCNDRKGDVINLQTWYSGKCTGNPKDPQSMGFSDIVLMDFYTLLQGEPGQTILGQGGVLPLFGNLIVKLYENPPASSVNYVAYLKDNLAKHSIVQPAYAQGVGYGFEGLTPILPLWRAFRNIVYMLFTLVFVFYGFMIMFRFKISPQAVTTIQTALPQIVVTLLLVTFSYAIAGFLIDLMYVVIGMVIAVLANNGFITQATAATWGIGNISLFEILLRFLLHAVLDLVNNMIVALTDLSGVLLTIANIGFVGIFGVFFAIFIILVSLYVMIKVFFMLLGAMVNVLLQIIFSPFILLMGIIPGRKSFGDWVRNIVANLAVFPAVITMFAFSFIFLGKYNFGVLSGIADIETINSFSLPEDTGGRFLAFPIIGASRDAKAVLAMVGFGFFLMTPKIAEMIRKALQVPEGGFGTAITEPLKFGYTAAPGQISGATGGLGYQLNRLYQSGQRQTQRIPGVPKPQQPSGSTTQQP